MVSQDIRFMPEADAKSAILAAQEGKYPIWVTFWSAKSNCVRRNWKMSQVEFCDGTMRSLGGSKSGKIGADFLRAVWHKGTKVPISIDIPNIIAIERR